MKRPFLTLVPLVPTPQSFGIGITTSDAVRVIRFPF